jgi:hypothetical protein
LIRIRYRDVVLEASLDTSLTARWGYRPLAVHDFAFETGELFSLPAGAEAFGTDGAVTARSNEERYRNAQMLMRQVIVMAHARGIQVAIGFEFGVHPPELASIVPPESRVAGAMLPDPTHPANIEILHATLHNLLTAYAGLDWVGLWLHEHSMFVAQPKLAGQFAACYEREKVHFSDAPNEHDVFTGIWSLAQIREVREYLAKHSPRTRLAIGGWGGGPHCRLLRDLDRRCHGDRVQLSESRHGGHGHAAVLGEVAAHRPTWAIPWLKETAHCGTCNRARLGQRASQGRVCREAVRRDWHPLAHRRDPREPRSLRLDGPRSTGAARGRAVPAALHRTLRSGCSRIVGAPATAIRAGEPARRSQFAGVLSLQPIVGPHVGGTGRRAGRSDSLIERLEPQRVRRSTGGISTGWPTTSAARCCWTKSAGRWSSLTH